MTDMEHAAARLKKLLESKALRKKLKKTRHTVRIKNFADALRDSTDAPDTQQR